MFAELSEMLAVLSCSQRCSSTGWPQLCCSHFGPFSEGEQDRLGQGVVDQLRQPVVSLPVPVLCLQI